ncbi:MAG: helix-hairpin-helix domain-containing protein [Bacteriovoracaceae bacterium]|nr:helix-hairpin-helix domain-containing protein [Bacteroidota bacterium]
MNLFKRLSDFFAFTKNEQKVFLFLSAVLMAGVAVKAYKAYIAPPVRTSFDYSASDSVFFARSSSAVADSGTTIQVPAVVNLNTATKEQLMLLPGIGEAMAERIMLHRLEKGKFKRMDELKKVKGIGEKKYEKLKSHIEVK